MKITLISGQEFEASRESIKRIVYQNVRGNTRYYVAVGNDLQAIEQEITKGCYNLLVKEITSGGTAKNGSGELLPNAKTGRGSRRKD